MTSDPTQLVGHLSQPRSQHSSSLAARVFSRMELPLREDQAASALSIALGEVLGCACVVLAIGPGGGCRQLAAHRRAERSVPDSRWAALLRDRELGAEPLLIEEVLREGVVGVAVPGWLQARWLLIVEGVAAPLDEARRELLLEAGWIARTALGAGDLLARGVQARQSADAASHRVIAVSRLIELLPSRLDLEETVASVLDAVVPYVGDWAVLFLRRPGGQLERAGLRHVSAEARDVLEGLSCFPLPPEPEQQAAWLERDEPFLIGDGDDPASAWPLLDAEREPVLEKVAPLTAIAAPLRRGDDAVGLLTVGTSASGQIYGRDEVRLLRELAKLARVGVESALLYAAAERAAKQREDVLAIVSHDLRNPLQTIRYAAMNLTLQPDSDKRDRQLELVDSSVDTMERLLQDLLDVSRIEAGHFAVEPRPCSAARLLEQAHASFSTGSDDEGVSLVLRQPPVVEVAADRDAVLRVLGNLLSNAISFTPRGGRVELSAQVAEPWVWFTIRDTGPGVPPDLLPHVFDRYWQAKRAARSGAGLGLAIAKGIVEAHGGEIVARSPEAGGAEFRFSLPLAAGNSPGGA